MHTINKQQYLDNLKERKPAPHKRAFYVNEIAQLTGKPFPQILGLTRHLPEHWIKDLLDDSEGNVKKFWWLLKQTRSNYQSN